MCRARSAGGELSLPPARVRWARALEPCARRLLQGRGLLELGPQVSADELTANMISIGLLFSGAGAVHADIERALAFASRDGMERGDYRVLSVLTTWLGVHARFVNVGRMRLLVEQLASARCCAYWAAVGAWLSVQDRRFALLRTLHRGARLGLFLMSDAETDFQIRRHGGEDPRFAHGPLRVPSRALRDRASDVADAAWLVARHAGFRWRAVLGATYVADAAVLLTSRHARSAGSSSP